MTPAELRAAADDAKRNKDWQKAAAILAALADILGEKPGRARTSPTWRECYSCNKRA